MQLNQSQNRAMSAAKFKLSGNPLMELFDHVTRIQQRELKPTQEELHLIYRSRVTRALLQYLDRAIDQAYGTPIYSRVRIIAYERFDPASSVEALIVELRKRIFKIHNLKKSLSH
jgi:hypothetical protein